MRNNLNRVCYCCGKKYHYCPTCYKQADKDPSVYTLFDCEECKEIFNILNNVTFDITSPLEAKHILNKMGINIDNANKYSSVKEHLINVLSTEDVSVNNDNINNNNNIKTKKYNNKKNSKNKKNIEVIKK